MMIWWYRQHPRYNSDILILPFFHGDRWYWPKILVINWYQDPFWGRGGGLSCLCPPNAPLILLSVSLMIPLYRVAENRLLPASAKIESTLPAKLSYEHFSPMKTYTQIPFFFTPPPEGLPFSLEFTIWAGTQFLTIQSQFVERLTPARMGNLVYDSRYPTAQRHPLQ